MKAIAFPIKFDFNLWAQMQKYAGKGESACHIMYLVFLSVLLHVSHCVCHWFSLCVYPCHWLVWSYTVYGNHALSVCTIQCSLCLVALFIVHCALFTVHFVHCAGFDEIAGRKEGVNHRHALNTFLTSRDNLDFIDGTNKQNWIKCSSRITCLIYICRFFCSVGWNKAISWIVGWCVTSFSHHSTWYGLEGERTHTIAK